MNNELHIPGLDVPAVDCLSHDDVNSLMYVYKNLAQLCEYQSAAMQERKQGCIAAAMRYEALAQKCYAKLPSNLQW